MKIKKENYFFAVLLIVCLTFAWFQLDKLSDEADYMEIVINDGDTLWDLAADYSGGIPAHHWIEQVRTLNELATDQIKSGETLRLPVTMDKKADHRLAEMGVEAR